MQDGIKKPNGVNIFWRLTSMKTLITNHIHTKMKLDKTEIKT